MAKHIGMTIRIGASHDQVEVRSSKLDHAAVFDRAQMRKDGKPELQGALRRQVVDTWAQMNEGRAKGKARTADRIKAQQKAKHRRDVYA